MVREHNRENVEQCIDELYDVKLKYGDKIYSEAVDEVI